MTIISAVIACGLLSVLYAIWATKSVLAADQEPDGGGDRKQPPGEQQHHDADDGDGGVLARQI
ncbi:MAG: hypothetical protein E5V57_33010, partial [Mesorhizobium sp.]